MMGDWQILRAMSQITGVHPRSGIPSIFSRCSDRLSGLDDRPLFRYGTRLLGYTLPWFFYAALVCFGFPVYLRRQVQLHGG